MAHTAGPWRYSLNTLKSVGLIIWRGDMPTNTNYVRIARNVATPADAALIAAAPDLLDALKTLLADIEDYQRLNNLGGEQNHAQVMARNAIALAESR